MYDPSSVKSLNISIVHRRIKHHAKHSGYSSVYEYMRLPHAEGGLISSIALKLPASIKWRLHTLRPQPVGDEGLVPELKAISTTASSKPGICHFIYGEDTYFYTPLWQHKNKKIVATFHYPPVRLNERVNRVLLKRLNAVLLMSESQRSWFEDYLPKDKIHVIHHQVNTDFFTPAETESSAKQNDKIRIICLGGILRDMKLLHQVVIDLNEQLGVEKVQFDFLMPKKERAAFEQFENVTIHSGISDEELRSLYQKATLGFMPLIDCTANNAVLEMMACGIPIVCSDVGGISDYIDDKGAIMFSPSITSADISQQIQVLCSDAERLISMGQSNRVKAVEQFSLQATSEKLTSFYQLLSSKD